MLLVATQMARSIAFVIVASLGTGLIVQTLTSALSISLSVMVTQYAQIPMEATPVAV